MINKLIFIINVKKEIVDFYNYPIHKIQHENTLYYVTRLTNHGYCVFLVRNTIQLANKLTINQIWYLRRNINKNDYVLVFNSRIYKYLLN